MTSRLKMFFRASMVLLMFLSVEIHADLLDDIIERGTLRIGVSLFVPWTMEDESGQLTNPEVSRNAIKWFISVCISEANTGTESTNVNTQS